MCSMLHLSSDVLLLIVGVALLSEFIRVVLRVYCFNVSDFTATIQALCMVVLKNREKNYLL